MKNDIDDLLDRAFGSRGLRSVKPAAPKQSAAKPAAKPARQTARPAARPAAPAADVPTLTLEGDTSAIDAIQQNVRDMSKTLDARIAAQRREIEALNQNALADIQRIGAELNSPEVQALSQPGGPVPAAPARRVGAEGFSGLLDALNKTVLGQEEYLKRLCIALKRPYVAGERAAGPKAAILVTGPADTGRHLSLRRASALLGDAGVFSPAPPAVLDLALYPTASEEKLFLTDLYAALVSDSDLVLFEHYGQCYAGFLSVLSDLVQTGGHALPARYVEQNGRLLDAGGALVKNAVSALSAKGKYLVFLTQDGPAKLADKFGGPFVSALDDVCETAPLAEDTRAAVAKACFEALAERVKERPGFTLTVTPGACAAAAALGGAAQKGASAVLACAQDAARALAQYKLEHEAASPAVTLDAVDGAVTLDFGEGPRPLASYLPAAYRGDVDAVKAELDTIVGLTEIKQYVLSLEENYAVQKRRQAAGLKTASVSMHMIFTGNPGTGKTTIARLVGKYLKAIGVLAGGQLVEVTRADLVGKYVGHTAPLTTQVIRSALGGVLFVDEAYSLYRGKDDSFGLEAIDTLVKGMEDHRDDLIVILAGYTKEMQQFLTANSGLKSRFPNVIEFPDYTGAELLAIARIQAKSKGYVLDERCDTPLLAYFNAVQLSRARDAGNGRLARNKIEEAILAQSRRAAKDPAADLSLLTPEDFALNDVNR